MEMVEHGGKTVTRVVEQFEAKDLGAPFKVVLKDAVLVTFDAATDEQLSYEIPDLDGLLRAIVIERLLNERKLSGKDVKYVRKVLGLTQRELSEKVDIVPEHLSRIETGIHPLSPGSEKLLRVYALTSAIRLHNADIDPKLKVRFEQAIGRVFDVMKPSVVRSLDDELVLHFCRANKEAPQLGRAANENGPWNGPSMAAA
ncbi:MAG: hypothetical protein K0Q69_708 [Devosia sp.]|jgi:transcriptional regulator with XRE-family HTH domain|nr:hypothetical protein [Devosia sp.]